jgi:hypothetical protein
MTAVFALGVGCAPAWASYGQMKLDGIVFLLAAILLYMWAIVLPLVLAARLARHKWVLVAVTVVTLVLTALFIASWEDGRSTMQPRPLRGPAMFVVLMLASVPVMLATPFMQWMDRDRVPHSRRPLWLLVAAVALPTVGSIAYAMVQDAYAERLFERTRAVQPGQVQSHVAAARRGAATTWLAPYLWSDGEQAKWIVIGLAQSGMVASPAPLSAADTQALADLVRSAPGTPSADYTGKIEAKLVWDRLMQAAPADRPAVAAGVSRQEAQEFTEYIVVPHTDWLCQAWADPPTEQAFVRVANTLSENDRPRFARAVKEKCGRDLPSPLSAKPRVAMPLSVR